MYKCDEIIAWALVMLLDVYLIFQNLQTHQPTKGL